LQKSDILTGGLDTLKKYITELARQKNISTKVIEKFEKHTQDNKKNNTSDITNLRQIPDNPIRDIMEINCVVLDKSENDLLKAFLCCNLARNYFAHHTYLDKEFMQSQREQAAFMLVGVLVTVLKLLDD
jgi:DNA polymerase III alpha subunit (gram-positive type)